MLIAQPEQAFRPVRTPFVPVVVTDKAAISVVGLGYVGAVTCGCLADLGHRVVGVDIDPVRVSTVGAGRSPMHEAGLDAMLQDAVGLGLLSATGDLAAAVSGTDVTFVSVGTPTARDGSCDTRFIAAVADGIGAALRDKDDFHAVVLRCSVPPGTTRGLMTRRIEAASGKTAGVDFGVAFVPEFLREGAAVEDFNAPPKTVIGATDTRTAGIVARIFAPIDAAPVLTGIETAELVKYVDNVWHATKVCFANEVGRLAKSIRVDGRAVMDIFCRDTKLNLSEAYLRPGFAYGGSCLPKEVRAVSHLARSNGVSLPLVESLDRSNAVQIAEALRMIRATGARRVGVLGLAFKPGTDDLRESPILDVMAELLADGVALSAHDRAIRSMSSLGSQLAYVRHGSSGLARLAQALPQTLRECPADVIAASDALVVVHGDPAYRNAVAQAAIPVIDLVGLFAPDCAPQGSEGIGW